MNGVEEQEQEGRQAHEQGQGRQEEKGSVR
jgi:hypothetical protein